MPNQPGGSYPRIQVLSCHRSLSCFRLSEFIAQIALVYFSIWMTHFPCLNLSRLGEQLRPSSTWLGNAIRQRYWVALFHRSQHEKYHLERSERSKFATAAAFLPGGKRTSKGSISSTSGWVLNLFVLPRYVVFAYAILCGTQCIRTLVKRVPV